MAVQLVSLSLLTDKRVRSANQNPLKPSLIVRTPPAASGNVRWIRSEALKPPLTADTTTDSLLSEQTRILSQIIIDGVDSTPTHVRKPRGWRLLLPSYVRLLFPGIKPILTHCGCRRCHDPPFPSEQLLRCEALFDRPPIRKRHV